MHPLRLGDWGEEESPHWLHPAVSAISWLVLRTDPPISNYGTLQNIQMHEVGSCSTRTPETVPKGNASLHSTPWAVNFLRSSPCCAHVKGLCALLDRVVQNLHSPMFPYLTVAATSTTHRGWLTAGSPSTSVTQDCASWLWFQTDTKTCLQRSGNAALHIPPELQFRFK